MEFYSERCGDWLEKTPNIHPDKLAMEITRFQGMLAQLGADPGSDNSSSSGNGSSNNNGSSSDNDELAEDLALTIQLLEERLHVVQGFLGLSEARPEPGLPVSTATSALEPSPSAYSLSERPHDDDPSWDTSALGLTEDVQPEIIDEETRQERKTALLEIPGIALGVKGLKTRT
jgi:hypothetical protein